MKTPITTLILPWLLHHANRIPCEEFYKIKNSILAKYGKHICYDVQFIEGKECYTCEGTGIYTGVRWSEIHWGKLVTYHETCYKCYNGWYKRPVWNILAKIQFGKYTFHQPYQRSYTKPDNSIQIIEGYIQHDETNYSEFALTVLYLLYRKGYLKLWISQSIRRKYLRLVNFFNRPAHWRESYGPFEYNELPF
jgi:hypothetical protein